jgi:hypothetical protein
MASLAAGDSALRIATVFGPDLASTGSGLSELTATDRERRCDVRSCCCGSIKESSRKNLGEVRTVRIAE